MLRQRLRQFFEMTWVDVASFSKHQLAEKGMEQKHWERGRVLAKGEKAMANGDGKWLLQGVDKGNKGNKTGTGGNG